jgi:hypothetical protein
VAVRKDRDAKAELNRRSQACEVLAGTGSRREKWTRCWHTATQGSAPCIPVWKVLAHGQGVYLSTLMVEEMESRAGIAPASAVLQTAA